MKIALKEDNLDVANYYINIGDVYYDLNNYNKELYYYEKALQIQIQLLGENHLDVASTYNHIGCIYHDLGKYNVALEYYIKALKIKIITLDENHIDVASSYNNIGSAYHDLGKYNVALEYYIKALEIKKITLDENHVDFADSYSNIGSTYSSLGDYTKALKYYEKALEIEKYVLGENHTDVALSYNDLGLVYSKKGEYDKALKYHEKAVEIFLSILGEQHIYVATSYSHISQVYSYLGDYSISLKYLEKALQIQISILGDKHPEVATSYNNMGVLYNTLGKYNKALEYNKKALEIEKTIFGENHPEVANLYSNISTVYSSLGNYNKALAYAKKTLQMQISILGDKHPDVATSYSNISVLNNILGEYNKALEYNKKALEIKRTVFGENHPEVANLYNNISTVYLSLGNYNKALTYAKRALQMQISILGDKHPNVATSYNNIGFLYNILGEYNKALDYHEKNLEILRVVLGDNHPDIANSYNSIGHVYTFLGDYNKALENYEKAFKICKTIFGEKHPNVAQSYSNIGFIYTNFGKYNKALEYYEKTLEIQKNVLGENHMHIANTYIDIALVYLNQEKYLNSFEFLKKYIEIVNSTQNYDDTIFRTWNIFANINKLIPIDYATQLHELEHNLVTTGIDAAERARVAMTSQKSDITAKALPLYYAGVNIEAAENNPSKAFYYSEALRSRGFLEQMGTESALKLDGITNDEREKVHNLMTDIQTYKTILIKQNEKVITERNVELIARTNEQLDIAEKELNHMDDILSKRIPKYEQMRNPQSITAEDAMAWCKDGKVILEYVLWNPSYTEAITKRGINTNTENDMLKINLKENMETTQLKSYCLVISEDSIKAIEIDGSFDYTKAISQLQDLIQNKVALDNNRGLKAKNKTQKNSAEDDLSNITKTLYQKIIAPVISVIPKNTTDIVIVPDGALSFLPFDILGEGNGEQDFGEKYSLSMSPSISVSLFSQKNKIVKSKSVIALGNSIYSKNNKSENRSAQIKETTLQDSPLFVDFSQAGKYYTERGFIWNNIPETGTEIHSLKNKVYKASTFKLLEGQEASEKTLKEMSNKKTLSNYSILHLACHGYFDNENNQMSSIILSEVSGSVPQSIEDGYLTLQEAALLNLNTNLVNLSACQTGLSKLTKGDGMTGLTRSFLVAGSKNVGVTLWPVDDKATCEFMIEMYSKVEKEGMTYKEAYKATKNDFRKNKKWSAPYYWAAFVLYE